MNDLHRIGHRIYIAGRVLSKQGQLWPRFHLSVFLWNF